MSKYNLVAQKEVEEAILCFLEDNKRATPDASQTVGDYTVHYNQSALNDAVVVIMEAFGKRAKIEAIG